MGDYLIRPANRADKQTIAKIYVSSWNFAYKGIVPQEYLDSLNVEKYLKKTENKAVPDEVLFEIDGRVVGLAKMIDCRDRCAEGCAEIQTIYFLPAFMGKGLGGIFLNWLKDHAKKLGYEMMIIWVLNDNQRARRAYEKAGFTKDKSRLVIIGGRELKESRYSHKL